MLPMDAATAERYAALKEFIGSFESALIAYSGGVDSSLVAYVTDEVAAGVTYTYAFYPGQNSNTVVSAITDPVTGVYNYKTGKGRVEKAGETPFKSVDAAMSFVPRTIA